MLLLHPVLSTLVLLVVISLLISTSHAVETATTAVSNNINNNDEVTHQKDSKQCERLPTSLTYKQDAAPADVSGILRVVVDKINRDVTGVVDVEVKWSGGELHKKVGERIVQCFVTRLAEEESATTATTDTTQEPTSTVDEHGRNVVTQCFEVPFTILDVNECTAPDSNPMKHKCREPSACVNTLGSYECVCPSSQGDSLEDLTRNFVAESYWDTLSNESRNAWELSLGSTSESSCPNLPSTHGCCDEDGHSKEGMNCRSSFRCPVDPCTKSGTCASNAICKRTESPLSNPNHLCQCPSGKMGNGYPCRTNMRKKEPKVKYDGKTPTEETHKALQSGLICGCSEPTVDACDGYPKCPGKHEVCTVDSSNTPHCVCQSGYVNDPDFGCVDENPPLLKLRPDPIHGTDKTGITHLSQGDKYEEYGVDVIDENAEEYLRSLKIAYSRPLPQGCLLDMGEFYVEYTVATPWTTPEFVRARRTVIIDNVNECLVKEGSKVGSTCPELVAMCDFDAGAVCKDEIGTYTCKCPKGTEGDGFSVIPRLSSDGKGGFIGAMVPHGYKGGSGCRDTSPPMIELLGPNPKRFRVAKASGIKGIMGIGENEESNARIEELVAKQRSAYEADIKSIIAATSGAELCATSTKTNVRPTDCVRAVDHTYKGIVNLSSSVQVGEPEPKNNGGPPLQWKVSYNVMDDAGNKAKTVWRDIIVEEVDIDDFERKAKADVATKANEPSTKQRRNNNKRDCPPCDPCNCNNAQRQQGRNEGGLSSAECNAECDSKIAAALAASSTGSADKATCTLPNEGVSRLSHQVIQKMLVYLEGLLGPSALMLLLLGCTLATILYVMSRVMAALFFGTGPHTRTYYHHTHEDDEREKIMLQNVSYYRSPTPSSNGSASRGGQSPGSSSGPPRPPTTSISSQRNNGMYSDNTPRQSPFRSSDGTDNIYETMSPITPLRNGTPSSSASHQQGSGERYNLRNVH